jgi:hypothetical protein
MLWWHWGLIFFFFSIVVFGLIGGGLYYYWPHHLSCSYAALDAQHLAEAQDGLAHWPPMNYTLPKIMWSYWHADILPPPIQQIIDARRRMLPDWDIRCLSATHVSRYIDTTTLPPHYHKLSHCHQADLIRLLLLEKYGGAWLDSSIIINKAAAFNKVYEQCQQHRSALLAFTLGGTEDYIENWCFLAPPRSFVVRFWRQELTKAITLGFVSYKRVVQHAGVLIHKKILAAGTYLTMHSALQVIRHRMPKALMATLTLLPAEEAMFRVHVACHWQKECITAAFTDPARFATTSAIPYIKLLGAATLTVDLAPYFQFLDHGIM